jgi:hypothetical protein
MYKINLAAQVVMEDIKDADEGKAFSTDELLKKELTPRKILPYICHKVHERSC